MKKVLAAMIPVLLLVIVGCGSQGKEAPTDSKVRENVGQKVKSGTEQGEPETYERLMADAAIKGAATYFERAQGSIPQNLREELAGIITESAAELPEAEKNKFGKLAKLIKEDKQSEAKKIFLELADIYSIQIVETPVNGSSTENSNELQKTKTVPQNDSNGGGKSKTSTGSKTSIIASLDPAKVKARVKSDSKNEWKDDYKMQVYYIDMQMGAYNELKDIMVKSEVEEGILKNAFDEWGYDFRMVLYKYKNQMNAYKKIKSINLDSDVKKEILDNALSEWGTDYEMVLYRYEQQLEAYKKLD